jgi:cytidine deaminase
MLNEIKNIPWKMLSEEAWKVRENARIIGKTKVGAAAITKKNNIYVGCNIEHKFHSHDIHAEVCAISNMLAQGDQKLVAILVVAERVFFTPCGACTDWIFEFADEECYIGIQNKPEGEVKIYNIKELMPYYPH